MKKATIITVAFLLLAAATIFFANRKRGRAYWEARIPEVCEILKAGSEKAAAVADQTLKEVKRAMKIDYFSPDGLLAVK